MAPSFTEQNFSLERPRHSHLVFSWHDTSPPVPAFVVQWQAEKKAAGRTALKNEVNNLSEHLCPCSLFISPHLFFSHPPFKRTFHWLFLKNIFFLDPCITKVEKFDLTLTFTFHSYALEVLDSLEKVPMNKMRLFPHLTLSSWRNVSNMC